MNCKDSSQHHGSDLVAVGNVNHSRETSIRLQSVGGTRIFYYVAVARVGAGLVGGDDVEGEVETDVVLAHGAAGDAEVESGLFGGHPKVSTVGDG